MDTPNLIDSKDVSEQIKTLFAGLPVPVQEFLTSDSRNRVILDISQKNNLHVDQAGEFEKSLLFMLLGIYSPDRFSSELQKSGLTPQVVNSILLEVDESVFKPIREEMLKTNGERTLEAPEKKLDLPTPRIEISKTKPISSGSQVAASEAPTIQSVRISEQKYGIPTPSTPDSKPSPVSVAPFHARTMASDMGALKEGRVPQPFVREVPPPIAPPAPTKPEEPTVKEIENTLKKYGVDPYRESVE